jgi:uncharacterized protein (DUF488 family)
MKIVTIGVYGFSEQGFFEALTEEGVDTFCDIRWRRGVRGSQYAFANSVRLQQRLRDLRIRYLHFRELAPSPSLRARQAEVDKASHTPKRKRTVLSPMFLDGYRQESLSSFNSADWIEQLGPEAKAIALFCVERDPAACHRSMLAERLQHDLGISVKHLLPPNGP